MHQIGALQGVVRTFAAQILMRNATQFLVNEGDRSVQGLVIAGMPVRQ
jgi:hypothetical protein